MAGVRRAASAAGPLAARSDPRRSPRPRRRPRQVRRLTEVRSLPSNFSSRQHHLEDCTTGPAADGYGAAVPLDDRLDDARGAPPDPRRSERARWTRLVEAIEYVWLLFGRDASPFVLDRQRDAIGRGC